MNRQDQTEIDPLARKALEHLLKSADKHEAGTAVRRPALTDSALSEYRELRSLKAKEDFEAVMAYAQAEGAIMVLRPRRDPQGLIERVELIDVIKLASILGKVPHAVRVQSARQALAARLGEHPVLNDVLSSWEKLKKVRGTGPDAANWTMAC